MYMYINNMYLYIDTPCVVGGDFLSTENICIYKYTYIHTYIYIYKCKYICVYIHTHILGTEKISSYHTGGIYIYIYTYTYMYIFPYIYV